jgi:hypothetical protein
MKRAGISLRHTRRQLAWAIGLYVAGVASMTAVSYALELLFR